MLRICTAFVLALLPIAVLAGPSGKIRVIDADTWAVAGEKVRLHGIDAPEMDQTCERANTVWACGEWATRQVRARYQGRTATCRAIEKDRYGRTVATCAVDGRDVGHDLVSGGLALAYREYSSAYVAVERRAARADIGLHGSRLQTPSQYRKTKVRAPAVHPANCAIKGNISSKGTWIYHAPGQRDYGATRISTAKGERWFCSEAQARAGGWRKARR